MENSGFWGLPYDGWVALTTLLLTAATIGLGVFTALLWLATKKAVVDSGESVKAAQRAAAAAEVAARSSVAALEQAVDASNKSLRAYVTCASDHIEFHKLPAEYQGDLIAFTLRIQLRNCGSTPAYQVRYGATIKAVAWPIDESEKLSGPENLDQFNIIGPNETIAGQLTKSLEIDSLGKSETEKRAYVIVRINYTDVYGIEQYSEVHWTMINLHSALDSIKRKGVVIGPQVGLEMVKGLSRAS